MEVKITEIKAATTDSVLNKNDLYSSEPAAGFGVPGDDSVEESLNIHELLVPNPTATFFVRVSGDSMEGAKIFNGDILVVDRSVVAKNNSIVVAAITGELLVKRLRQTQTITQLISENPDYAPINLDSTDECFVWGVVIGSARKLT